MGRKITIDAFHNNRFCKKYGDQENTDSIIANEMLSGFRERYHFILINQF
jgi:hypothetical protein